MPAVATPTAHPAPTARATGPAVRPQGLWGPWLLAWLGGPVIGIANGVARELLYAERVGDRTAHQLSTASALVLFALYLGEVERRWPLPTRRAALSVGGAWVGLTILFEFGFGHYADGKSWPELVRDYDVTAGRLWPLVLLWLGVGPALISGLRRRRRPEDMQRRSA